EAEARRCGGESLLQYRAAAVVVELRDAARLVGVDVVALNIVNATRQIVQRGRVIQIDVAGVGRDDGPGVLDGALPPRYVVAGEIERLSRRNDDAARAIDLTATPIGRAVDRQGAAAAEKAIRDTQSSGADRRAIVQIDPTAADRHRTDACDGPVERSLPAVPTRRSSDLVATGQRHRSAAEDNHPG